MHGEYEKKDRMCIGTHRIEKLSCRWTRRLFTVRFYFRRESVNITSLILMLMLILILSSVNTSVRISKLNPIYNITEAPIVPLKSNNLLLLSVFHTQNIPVFYCVLWNRLQLWPIPCRWLSYLQSLCLSWSLTSLPTLLPFLILSLVSHTQSLHIFFICTYFITQQNICRNLYNCVN